MDRSKIVAILTGAIALLLGVAYLVIVQLLDFRGEMIPAPVDLSVVMRVGLSVAELPALKTTLDSIAASGLDFLV